MTGPELTALREARSISLLELAKLAGVSCGTLRSWESGKHKPQMRVVRAVSKALLGAEKLPTVKN